MDDENKPSWEYKPDGTAGGSLPDDDSPIEDEPAYAVKTVAWEAPEFIEHHHGFGWYLALLVVTAALAAIVFLISSRDIIATTVVLILGVIVGVFAGHKPAVAQYEITSAGISVNGKVYKYGDYKSFSIFREGELSSVNFFPLKRFLPPLAVYFKQSEEKKIADAVGNYLPYEERKLDTIDRLSRRLRL